MKQNFNELITQGDEAKVINYTLHAIISFDKLQTRLLHPIVVTDAVDTYKELSAIRDYEGHRILTIHISKVAKCNPGDSYNKELGKRIAQSRAYIRYYHIMNMIFKNTINYYKKLGLQPIDDNCWLAKTAAEFHLKYNNECIHLNEMLKDL